MRFADLVDEVGKRIHIGCILAAGHDWIELSMPPETTFGPTGRVRFLPSLLTHDVATGWRDNDRVGLVYTKGGPPDEQLSGIPGLWDHRSALMMMRSKQSQQDASPPE